MRGHVATAEASQFQTRRIFCCGAERTTGTRGCTFSRRRVSRSGVRVRSAFRSWLADVTNACKRNRIALTARWTATVVAAACCSTYGTPSAMAQVLLPPMPPPPTPWNAQRVFEPVPFLHRWEIEGVDGILPEDTPVRTRLQPGYEPRGIRAGTWMFHPSLTVGGFYSSNVFATPTDQRSDVALRVHPSLRAYTLWG